MEYAYLGRSGLSVSRLCLGTMNFGPLTPPGEAHAIMDRALEIGINFFDTANRYGGLQSPPGQARRPGSPGSRCSAWRRRRSPSWGWPRARRAW
jgi:diketogulonate reductase-like aldo/keto reductase